MPSRLSPDMQAIARALATGQILLCAPAAPGEIAAALEHREMLPSTVTGGPYGITACTDDSALCSVLDKPKEPWRRGRPVR